MPWATAYVPNQPGRVLCDGCGAISRACFFGKVEAAKRASAHFKGKKTYGKISCPKCQCLPEGETLFQEHWMLALSDVLACDVPEFYTDKTHASSADACTFQGDFPTLPPPSPRASSKKAPLNTSTFACTIAWPASEALIQYARSKTPPKEIPVGFGLVPQAAISVEDQDEDEDNPWAELADD